MTKLSFTIGLPYSGKTTYCRNVIRENSLKEQPLKIIHLERAKYPTDEEYIEDFYRYFRALPDEILLDISFYCMIDLFAFLRKMEFLQISNYLNEIHINHFSSGLISNLIKNKGCRLDSPEDRELKLSGGIEKLFEKFSKFETERILDYNKDFKKFLEDIINVPFHKLNNIKIYTTVRSPNDKSNTEILMDWLNIDSTILNSDEWIVKDVNENGLESFLYANIQPNFDFFDKMLTLLCPEISYLQYKKLSAACIKILSNNVRIAVEKFREYGRYELNIENMYLTLIELGLIPKNTEEFIELLKNKPFHEN